MASPRPISTPFNYTDAAASLDTYLSKKNTLEVVSVGCFFGGMFLSFVPLFLPLGNKWNPSTLNEDVPPERLNLLAISLTIAGLVVTMLLSAWATLQGEHYRNLIDLTVSRAVVAENGSLTPAKIKFLQMYGSECRRLLTNNPIYMNMRQQLIPYLFSSKLFNPAKNVWEYVDPNYVHRARG